MKDMERKYFEDMVKQWQELAFAERKRADEWKKKYEELKQYVDDKKSM